MTNPRYLFPAFILSACVGSEPPVSSEPLEADTSAEVLAGPPACDYRTWYEFSPVAIQGIADSFLAQHFPHVVSRSLPPQPNGVSADVHVIIDNPSLVPATTGVQLVDDQGGGDNALFFTADIQVRLAEWSGSVSPLNVPSDTRTSGTISVPIDLSLETPGWIVGNRMAIEASNTQFDEVELDVPFASFGPVGGVIEFGIRAAIFDLVTEFEPVKLDLSDYLALNTDDLAWLLDPWAIMLQKTGPGHRVVAMRTSQSDLTPCAAEPQQLTATQLSSPYAGVRIPAQHAVTFINERMAEFTGSPQFETAVDALAEYGLPIAEDDISVSLTGSGLRVHVLDYSSPQPFEISRSGCDITGGVAGGVWLDANVSYDSAAHYPNVSIGLGHDLYFSGLDADCGSFFADLFVNAVLDNDRVQDMITTFLPDIRSMLDNAAIELEATIADGLAPAPGQELVLFPSNAQLGANGFGVTAYVHTGPVDEIADAEIEFSATSPNGEFDDLEFSNLTNHYLPQYCPTMLGISLGCHHLPASKEGGYPLDMTIDMKLTPNYYSNPTGEDISVYRTYPAPGAGSPIEALLSGNSTKQMVAHGAPSSVSNVQGGTSFMAGGVHYLVTRTGRQVTNGLGQPWFRMLRIEPGVAEAAAPTGWESLAMKSFSKQVLETKNEVYASEGGWAPSQTVQKITKYRVAAEAEWTGPMWQGVALGWYLDGELIATGPVLNEVISSPLGAANAHQLRLYAQPHEFVGGGDTPMAKVVDRDFTLRRASRRSRTASNPSRGSRSGRRPRR